MLKRPTRNGLRCRIAAVGLGCGGLVLTIVLSPRPWLVWNASASVPIGLYGVTGAGNIAKGDMVIARVPASWRTRAAARPYIPADVPLVKRVVAISAKPSVPWGQRSSSTAGPSLSVGRSIAAAAGCPGGRVG